MDRSLRRRRGRAGTAPLTAIRVEGRCGLPRERWRGEATLLFRRVVYFSDGRAPMIALVARSLAASPAGFRLASERPAEDLRCRPCSRLEFDGQRWRLDGRLLDLSGLEGRDEPTRIEPGPRIAPLGPLTYRLGPFLPRGQADPQWSVLTRTAEILARTDPRDPATTAELAALVGRGPGSTPTGDDFLVGWFAGMARQGRPDLPARAVLEANLSRTCRLSRHFLHHALSGCFQNAFVRLARLPGVPDPHHPVARALLALGDTSGRAAFLGYLAGLYQGA
jgi:hypothetical protein